ncbi:MAG: hypothetical protein QOG15_1213 [Solirubrobacteraceae bacterium]|nr:hypothetical protein [Solirubrobacteraceae bacterium]
MSHSPYADAIMRLAPDEDPALIEAWMRLEYGTLEGIDRVRFAGAVQAATKRAQAAGIQASQRLARAYGLEPSPGSDVGA